MRAGSVVTIRVNPRDSMSVVDLAKQSGLVMEGMSFAQMVSLTLSGCLEELRKKGIVPDREGFEYSQIVGPYLNQRNGKKLAITEQIHKMGSEFRVELTLPETPEVLPEFTSTARKEGATEEEENAMWARVKEIQDKGSDLTTMERLELAELERKLF